MQKEVRDEFSACAAFDATRSPFLSVCVCTLSLHRGRSALCGPEQAPHHRHDAQLCGAEGLEYLWAGDQAAQHAGDRRDQSHPDRMCWAARHHELPGSGGPEAHHQDADGHQVARALQQQAHLQVLEAAALRDALQTHGAPEHLPRAGAWCQRAGSVRRAPDRLGHLHGSCHLHCHGDGTAGLAFDLP